MGVGGIGGYVPFPSSPGAAEVGMAERPIGGYQFCGKCGKETVKLFLRKAFDRYTGEEDHYYIRICPVYEGKWYLRSTSLVALSHPFLQHECGCPF